MNSRYAIQLIVVAASVVLGMFLYPFLLKKVTRLVEWLYWNMIGSASKEIPGDVKKTNAETNEKPSVIGESKTKLGHDRTTTATSSENEKVIGKENTFVPETDEDTGPMDEINIPLDKEENLTEEEFNSDEESLELETEEGAVQASGASYDELINVGLVITKEKPSNVEKEEAGRVLYENKSTEVVEQIISHDEQTLTKVNALIHFHMRKHNLNEDNNNISGSEEFEDFDINSIF